MAPTYEYSSVAKKLVATKEHRRERKNGNLRRFGDVNGITNKGITFTRIPFRNICETRSSGEDPNSANWRRQRLGHH